MTYDVQETKQNEVKGDFRIKIVEIMSRLHKNSILTGLDRC